MQEYSVEITLNHPDDVLSLFGTNERHLKLIEENLNVIIHARTERVQILGDDEESVELARLTIQALLVLVERGMLVNTSDVVAALTMAQDGSIDKFVALYEEEIIKDNSGKPIRVKTLGQKVYVDSIKNHDVVFGIGPAGTGKTFLAVTLRTFALFMMPFIKFSVRSRRPALWNVKLLRLPPSLICVVVPLRMPLLSLMRHKIQPSCK